MHFATLESLTSYVGIQYNRVRATAEAEQVIACDENVVTFRKVFDPITVDGNFRVAHFAPMWRIE